MSFDLYDNDDDDESPMDIILDDLTNYCNTDQLAKLRILMEGISRKSQFVVDLGLFVIEYVARETDDWEAFLTAENLDKFLDSNNTKTMLAGNIGLEMENLGNTLDMQENFASYMSEVFISLFE